MIKLFGFKNLEIQCCLQYLGNNAGVSLDSSILWTQKMGKNFSLIWSNVIW